MADVYQIIADAAQRHSVPVEALLAIAKIESNFNAAADNPHSSASGVFQFTDGTAGDYGLTGGKRNDVEAQAEAAAKMAATNTRALTSALGRAPTTGELYLAHQQGLAGAKALLTNPDTPAWQVLSRYYGDDAANVISQNGGAANMTAGQFANKWVNKGNQVASLFPPENIPTAGPAAAPSPIPAMPSIDMQQMRRITAPSQLIPDTFGSLSKPSRNLGDTLAMNPVQGGQQQAPMFDAAYDTRTGQMRMTRSPIDSQGIAVGQSKPPAPIPAIPSPQLAARRATDPTLQAALNARYPAQLPPIPGPSTPKVQTAFSYAGQDASKPRPFPTDLQIAAATPFRGGGVPPVPDRLVANVFPQGEAPPVTGIGGRAVAPIPFVRPPGLGNAQALAPVPMPRLSRPAPKIAPMPMPLAMRPAPRPSQPPLRVTVNGGNAPARPTPQGYTDTGNGRLVNDETGGVYYTRHLR